MIKRNTSLYWIAFCLLAAGCAQQTPKPTPGYTPPVREAAATTVRAASTETLLRYAQSFSGMTAEAQKRELASLTKQRRGETSRMQLLMIYSQPGGRYRDPARALALADEHLKSPDSRDEELRVLAQWIKAQLAESQKQEDFASALQQKLKDEQARTENLQRKLDELLAIEKAMSERIQKK